MGDDKNGCYVMFPRPGHAGWQDGGEGGMFVRLVVVDSQMETDDEWMACPGGYSYTIHDEVMLGEDREHPRCDCPECEERRTVGDVDWSRIHHHFPRFHTWDTTETFPEAHYANTSRPYLAALTLGSTTQDPMERDAGRIRRPVHLHV